MRIFVGQGNFTDDTDESYNELSGTWEKVPDSGRGVERCGLPQYDGDRHRTVRPEDQGLFDICGKGASFLGTMIVSVGSQLTGSANVGIGMLAVLFAVGFVLFRVSCRTEHAKQV